MARQAEGHVGRHGALPMHDGMGTWRVDMQILCQVVLADPRRCQELFFRTSFLINRCFEIRFPELSGADMRTNVSAGCRQRGQS